MILLIAVRRKGGRKRPEGSFRLYKNFIRDMGMTEVKFRGRQWT